MLSLGIDDSYRIDRMQKLFLKPSLTGDAYRWSVDGRIVSEEKDFIFIAEKEGSYDLKFEIIDDESPLSQDITVLVTHEEVEYTPYIARVYEYRPAPGQFVNEMPVYEEGDTYANMLAKVERSISGTNDELISLGGFGGYVTFGFDHTVVNVEGEYDFRIWGNSFYERNNMERPGGSSEPGIVMVSYDANCNGLPDDEWYELAGSAYRDLATLHNYSVTYYRDYDRMPAGILSDYTLYTEISEPANITTKTAYPWADSLHRFGFIASNRAHAKSCWPKWISDDELTFAGTCLPPNAEDINGNRSHFVLYAFDWGYADNHPNDKEQLNSFKIDWAVDKDGNPVKLPGADFIRVYTGINQLCGWLGETSTELSRAADLHL